MKDFYAKWSVSCGSPTLARLCRAITMHEGPLHVYDMAVSDLLAPRGNYHQIIFRGKL